VLAVAHNLASSSTRDMVGPVVESTILSVPYMDITTLMRRGCISLDVHGYDGDRE
jgi:hypothetical protein